MTITQDLNADTNTNTVEVQIEMNPPQDEIVEDRLESFEESMTDPTERAGLVSSLNGIEGIPNVTSISSVKLRVTTPEVR